MILNYSISPIVIQKTESIPSSSQTTHFQTSPSRSFRSSLRQFKLAMGSSPHKIDYLILENEIDADRLKGCPSNSIYDQNAFFRTIARRYAEAADLALEAGLPLEAARIMEKEALVYIEKLDISLFATDRLFSAYQIHSEAGNTEKAKELLQQIDDLIDSRITLERQELLLDPDSLNSINLTHLLLYKAEILELTNRSQQTEVLYREAAERCLELDDEETAYGHLHPALIAGLCFDKCPGMEKEAQAAYTKTLEMGPLLIAEKSKDDPEGLLYSAIYFAPAYRQMSLASLKLGNLDLFSQLTEAQLKLLASLNPPEDPSSYLTGYCRALTDVNYALTGKISEVDFPASEITDLVTKALLDIYTAPPELSVHEMVKRLEERGILLGP